MSSALRNNKRKEGLEEGGDAGPVNPAKRNKADEAAAPASSASSRTADSNSKDGEESAKNAKIVLRDFGYIPKQAINRLEMAVGHSYTGNTRYRLVDLDPTVTNWGGRMRNVISINGTPVTICFVARVVEKKLPGVLPGGYERKATVLRLKFLREVDEKAAQKLIFGKYDPVLVTNKTTQGCMIPKGSKDKKKDDGWREIWDGTKKFIAKSKMTRLTIADVNTNDICMFECQGTRYNTQSSGWNDGWDVNFRAEAITKLYTAPDDASDYEESPDDGEREDTDDEFGGF